MSQDQRRENYHYKLVREHSKLEHWGHIAQNDSEAREFFEKKLRVPVEVCLSSGSYRLEKYTIPASGNVRLENLVKVTFVKQRASATEEGELKLLA